MDWQRWVIAADGTLTSTAIIIIMVLIALLILHEWTRPRLPRVRTPLGYALSLLMIPLFALFLSVVVIRVIHVLDS